MRRRHEVGRPVIDLNPPPGRYALQQFKEHQFKVGHARRMQAAALDADTGWLFGDNPFKVGAVLRLTDNNPEGLPPYNFAMGARRPSIFGLGLAVARRRR